MPHPHIKDGGVTRWLAAEVEEHLDRFPDRAALHAEMERQSTKVEGALKARTVWADQRAK